MKKRQILLSLSLLLSVATITLSLTKPKPKIELELEPKSENDLDVIHLFNPISGDYEGFCDMNDEDVNLTEQEIKDLENSNNFIPFIGITKSEILSRL